MSVYGDSLFGWISFYNGRNFLYGKIYKIRKFSASDEATKTNEEIIKHKNVLVKKYDSFIKNYEEQLSYFKNEYNSRHKENICKI